jgi:pyruvate formate lyase activating enzyme
MVIKMIIKGFQKLTLLDYPGRTACTVFTGGCNFRCPFCHNALLVTEQDNDFYPEEDVFEHLKMRKNVLDGVAVTGGEPLLQKDIERFLYEIKDLGYDIKLDTNGSFPEKLAGILELGLADYVAMDIKNSPTKYAETIGLKAFDLAPVQESINILKNSGVDYEFRTTVTADFHTKDSMKELSEWIMNTPKYFLQNFVDSGQLIDSNCRGVSKAEMYELLDIVRVNIPNAQIRGI